MNRAVILPAALAAVAATGLPARAQIIVQAVSGCSIYYAATSGSYDTVANWYNDLARATPAGHIPNANDVACWSNGIVVTQDDTTQHPVGSILGGELTVSGGGLTLTNTSPADPVSEAPTTAPASTVDGLIITGGDLSDSPGAGTINTPLTPDSSFTPAGTIIGSFGTPGLTVNGPIDWDTTGPATSSIGANGALALTQTGTFSFTIRGDGAETLAQGSTVSSPNNVTITAPKLQPQANTTLTTTANLVLGAATASYSSSAVDDGAVFTAAGITAPGDNTVRTPGWTTHVTGTTSDVQSDLLQVGPLVLDAAASINLPMLTELIVASGTINGTISGTGRLQAGLVVGPTTTFTDSAHVTVNVQVQGTAAVAGTGVQPSTLGVTGDLTGLGTVAVTGQVDILTGADISVGQLTQSAGSELGIDSSGAGVATFDATVVSTGSPVHFSAPVTVTNGGSFTTTANLSLGAGPIVRSGATTTSFSAGSVSTTGTDADFGGNPLTLTGETGPTVIPSANTLEAASVDVTGGSLAVDGTLTTPSDAAPAEGSRIEGTTVASGGPLTIESSASLSGDGTIGSADLTTALTNHGTTAPGFTTSTAVPGTLTVNGDVTSDGTVRVRVASGTSFDVLAATGDVQLDGTVAPALVPTYEPAQGTTYDVVTAAGTLMGDPTLNPTTSFSGAVVGSDYVLTANGPDPTTTSLSLDQNPTTTGHLEGLTATVASGSGGTVTFLDGTTVLATVSAVDGSYSFSQQFTHGTHTLTARYDGDTIGPNGHAPSTSDPSDLVVNGPDAPGVTADPGHRSAMIHVTAPAGADAEGITSYTVTLSQHYSGVPPQSGPAGDFTFTGLTPDAVYNVQVTATDGTNTSPAAFTTVTPYGDDADTTTSLGVSPNPATSTTMVTLTATVTGATSQGSVTFKDGSADIGTAQALSGGTASLTTTFTRGSHDLTAVYSGQTGTPGIAGSTSDGQTLVVRDLPGAPGVSATPGDHSATVTVTAPADDGGADISTYTVTLGSGDGQQTMTRTTPGSVTFTGLTNGTTYPVSATATNAAGPGPAGTTTVTPASTTVTTTTDLAVDPNPATSTTVVTLTATVTGGASGGTVTFSEGSTVLGTQPLSGTTATLTHTFARGSHSLTASYGGDTAGTTHTASTSPAQTLVVRDAPGAPGVTTVSGNHQVTVTVTAPASDGGSAITAYTVTVDGATPSTRTLTTPGSVTVTGLTNGVVHAVSVTATNAAGTGPATKASPTPAGAPDAPSITGVAPAPGRVTFTVTPGFGEGSKFLGTTVTCVSRTGRPTVTATSTGTTVTLRGLVDNTDYDCSAVTLSDQGPSAASHSVVGRPGRLPVITLKATLGGHHVTKAPKGSTLVLKGTARVSGQPVKPSTMTITARADGSSKRLVIGHVTTRADGTFSFTVTLSRSEAFRAVLAVGAARAFNPETHVRALSRAQ